MMGRKTMMDQTLQERHRARIESRKKPFWRTCGGWAQERVSQKGGESCRDCVSQAEGRGSPLDS